LNQSSTGAVRFFANVFFCPAGVDCCPYTDVALPVAIAKLRLDG
jgi:hypothetical protein